MKREERDGKAEAAKPEGHAHAHLFALHPATPVIHSLGLVEYLPTWEAMKKFTAARIPDGDIPGTRDAIWLVQHPPVYTQGLAGKPEHMLVPTTIPVVRVDRGGQITYHGPGQAIAYVLLDLSRRSLTVRRLVSLLEQSVIDLAAAYNLRASRRPGAPGVYVEGAKLAALGLRIRRGCSYHGLALNVDMDLAPFRAIDPCGYPGLPVTDLRTLGGRDDFRAVQEKLAQAILVQLGER